MRKSCPLFAETGHYRKAKCHSYSEPMLLFCSEPMLLFCNRRLLHSLRFAECIRIVSSGITGFLQSLADRPIRVLEIETFFSIMSRRLQLPDPETKSLRRSDEDALPAGSCRRHEAS